VCHRPFSLVIDAACYGPPTRTITIVNNDKNNNTRIREISSSSLTTTTITTIKGKK